MNDNYPATDIGPNCERCAADEHDADKCPKGERDAFEEAVFLQYFLSTIHRNPNPPRGTGAMDFVSEDCKTKADFLVKNADGTYQSDALNAAWWAWNERSKIAPPEMLLALKLARSQLMIGTVAVAGYSKRHQVAIDAVNEAIATVERK